VHTQIIRFKNQASGSRLPEDAVDPLPNLAASEYDKHLTWPV